MPPGYTHGVGKLIQIVAFEVDVSAGSVNTPSGNTVVGEPAKLLSNVLLRVAAVAFVVPRRTSSCSSCDAALCAPSWRKPMRVMGVLAGMFRSQSS